MGRKDKQISQENSSHMQLGLQMRQARQQKGISITEMAKQLNYTKSHLSAVETGNGRPSSELVEGYETILELAPGSLTSALSGSPSRVNRRLAFRHDLRVMPARSTRKPKNSLIEINENEPSSEPVYPLPTFPREQQDLGEVPQVEHFYGREKERGELVDWILEDRCRAISLSGFGGIGKTSLAALVVRQIKDHFTFILWRSLHNAPKPEDILADCIVHFSNQERINLPEKIDERISLLITYFRRNRCLLILDNLESVLKEASKAGQYKEGYEGYGQLIQRVGELEHQSCLLITGREKPEEFIPLEGKKLPLRSMSLPGVDLAEGKKILQDEELEGDNAAWEQLINLYAGNPLALKLVAEPIRDLFGYSIAAFLQQEQVVVGDIVTLLDQQFERLSPQEQEIIYWLAIDREDVALDSLYSDIIRTVPSRDLLESFMSLKRRSMIENRGKALFGLQPAILEYVTNRLVKLVCAEIQSGDINLLASHALIKAQAKDYVRDTQVRLILSPIMDWLHTTLGLEESKARLKQILTRLHSPAWQIPNYAAGNILNILLSLQSQTDTVISLMDYDFSGLTIYQAYLQGATLTDMNFAFSDLRKSVFTDTFGNIIAVTVIDSPVGELLAAGCVNGEVRVWKTEGAVPLMNLQGHTDWVRAVSFNHDGTQLASSSEDQTIRLWDLATQQCINILTGHADFVWSVAFSPDGNILASGSEDQTIRLWDIQTGECIGQLEGHTNGVWSVAFSPDGKLLASGSKDHTIRLWDIASRQCTGTLEEHTHSVCAVAFSPTGKILASGSEDQTIRLWDIETQQCFKQLREHANLVLSVTFSPDEEGAYLASASSDQTVRIWEVESGKCLKVLHGHKSWVRSVAFSSDGQKIMSGCDDQTIRIWEVNSGQCLKKLQGYANWIYSVAFSPDGKYLANGSEDQMVYIWDVANRALHKKLPGHTNRVRSVDFSPDSTLLVSGSDGQTIYLWDVKAGQPFKKLQGHANWMIYSVAFKPGGDVIASGGDVAVRLWRVQTRECFKTLPGHTDWIWSVVFSPDGSLLASGSEDKTVRIWDANTGHCLHILHHTNRVRSVAFNPHETVLASGGEDKIVHLWDLPTGQSLHQLSHPHHVRSVSFSPDGSLLACGCDDKKIYVWDIHSAQLAKTMLGHTNGIYSVSFHPSGALIASGSHDGTIKLWNLSTGQCVETLKNDLPYERMDITALKGITEAQRLGLKELGAIEQ